MAHFEATVRLFEVIEPNASAARDAIEERLRTAGFGRWQIVSVGLQEAITPAVRVSRRSLQASGSYAGGSFLVIASAVWALWFLYVLAG